MGLAIDSALCDTSDPIGKMFFNVPATFVGFETDLIRMRTHEEMAIARASGQPRSKQWADEFFSAITVRPNGYLPLKAGAAKVACRRSLLFPQRARCIFSRQIFSSSS